MNTTKRPRRSTRSIGSLALLAALAACATSAPGWLDERPAAYADERWVVGVGHGNDAVAAQASARADVLRQTNGETDQAEPTDAWVDPDRGTHWAMAVLDRVPLRESAYAQRAAVEEQINQKLSAADRARPERALRELSRALSLAGQRQVLDERISNLGGSDGSAIATPPQAEIERRLAEIKHQLPIQVESYEMDPQSGEIGDPLDQARRALAKKVTELGFPVSGNAPEWGDGDATWLIVRARLALDRLYLHERDQVVAVRWDAALEIKDLADRGDLVAMRTEEGRATHLNEHEARRLAQEQAADFAASALDDWLATKMGADVR